MTQLLVYALMTTGAILVVLWPLSRRSFAGPSGCDLIVYRDQLDEIARDRAAGLIGEPEAAAARIEVSRRLLAAADAARSDATEDALKPVLWRRRLAAIVALVVTGIALVRGRRTAP